MTASSDIVAIGSTVTVVWNMIEKSFRIVHPTSSDVEKGCISYDSPCAKALIGSHIGDTVILELPDGSTTQIKILDIS